MTVTYPYDDLPTVTASDQCNVDWANDNVVDPLNALKDELGDDPSGSAASVQARLDAEHDSMGLHSGAIVLAEADIPTLNDYLAVDGSDHMEGNLDLSSYYLTGMSYEVGIGYNRLIGASYKVQLGNENCAPHATALTTAQRNALDPCDGMFIYNITTNKFQGFANRSWIDFH